MKNISTLADKTLNDPSAYFQDGLVDLFLGWVAILSGVGFLISLPYLGGISPAIYLPVYQSLRNKVTKPRLRNQPRPAVSQNLYIAGIMLGLIGVMIIFFLNAGKLAWLESWMHKYSQIGFGIFIAGIIAVLGAVLRINRFYSYCGILTILFLLGDKFNIDLGWNFIAFGILVTLNGFAVLFRFIQNNPVYK